MGSDGLSAFYDSTSKKWIIPGESTSNDRSIGPPPITPSESLSNNSNYSSSSTLSSNFTNTCNNNLNNNNNDSNNNNNNSNDPIEALMALPNRTYPAIPHSLSLPSFTNTVASSLFQPKKVMKDGMNLCIYLYI
jgi:hypothetical protein